MRREDRQNVSVILAVGIIALSLLGSSNSHAFAQPEKKPAPPTEPIKPIAMSGGLGRSPTYKPPLRGSPSGRIGGGTRGGGTLERSAVLAVLTPDHVGLTTQEQPSLFWYISQPTIDTVELTVIESQAIKPVLETRLNPATQPGIQRIRLADHNLRLKTGIQYRWYVAVIPDSKNRSKDILAGGFIERIELSDNLRSRLAQAGAESAFVYAEEGVWYDALSSLSDMVDAKSSDTSARLQRAALLEQVRLQQVADFERGAKN
jgi:hypothetical protein